MQGVSISPANVVSAQPLTIRKRPRVDDDDDGDNHSHRSKKSPRPAASPPKASGEVKLPQTSAIFVDNGPEAGQAQQDDDDEDDEEEEEDEEEEAVKKASDMCQLG